MVSLNVTQFLAFQGAVLSTILGECFVPNISINIQFIILPGHLSNDTHVHNNDWCSTNVPTQRVESLNIKTLLSNTRATLLQMFVSFAYLIFCLS